MISVHGATHSDDVGGVREEEESSLIRKEIMEGLGTIGRLRIMAFLAEHPNQSFTKYTLLARTGLKRSDLKKNLAILVSIKRVKEYKSLYPKYEIDLDNKRVELFVRFLRESRYL